MKLKKLYSKLISAYKAHKASKMQRFRVITQMQAGSGPMVEIDKVFAAKSREDLEARIVKLVLPDYSNETLWIGELFIMKTHEPVS